MTPDAAFIAWSALETYTLAVKVVPTACEPEEGEKYKFAALANCGVMTKNAKAKIASVIIFRYVFFSITFAL